MRNIVSPLDGILSPCVRRGFNALASLSNGAAILSAWRPSRLDTLFQDRAGTTPVTAPGQPVGFVQDATGGVNHLTAINDASRGTYGIEPVGGRRNLLTWTEDFDNAAWQKQANVTVTPNADTDPNGALRADRLNFAGTTNDSIFQGVSFSAGQTCTFSVHVRGTAGQTIQVSVQHTNGGNTFTPVTLNGSWQRVSATATASTGGNANMVVDSAGANPAANCLVWGAQVELGPIATPYQRVNSAFDVTEAGVRSVGYIAFDGVDDGYSTPVITPGVDKAQVFAGVRKLSDAATGALLELSVNAGSNNGVIDVQAPSGAAANYRFGSRGTIGQAATPSGFASPITNVLAGIGDISGDGATLRINGVLAAQSTGDQGTGNYLSYPLFVGRRGGSSLPFNGRLYDLIVRFSATNLDPALIQAVEREVGFNTGVTL